jgi:hypothetical protein
MYKTIRNIHLLFASAALPFLIMYSISAVQMSHASWFQMKPSVHERDIPLPPRDGDARAIARNVMERDRTITGEITNVQPNAQGVTFRIVVPGTVHEVRYDRQSGVANVRTNIAGVMGMLNRLHHWAGFWHEPVSMKLWAIAVAIVSAAVLLVGGTGVCMWFTRRAERRMGIALLAFNLIFAVTLLSLLRVAGP